MMKKLLPFLFLILAEICEAQADTAKWVRAFPVTGYMVDLNDSIKVVQLYLPDGPALTEKQPGLLRGVYKDGKADTAEIGAGRCYLIKGDYYYFTINYKKSGITPGENDLLYTVTDKPAVYRKRIIGLASHFIELQNVHEEPFYDRLAVFQKWTEPDEERVIDSMVSDIQFTGRYFRENDPATDVDIKSGDFKGKKVLSVMAACKPGYVKDFFDYIIVRPRLYAGRRWKLPEIFATWLSSGAPKVIRE